MKKDMFDYGLPLAPFGHDFKSVTPLEVIDHDTPSEFSSGHNGVSMTKTMY